jgi:outer membrane protein assembly factor BamB
MATTATATAPKEKPMSGLSGLSASRPPASHVAPVVVDGVRYEPTSQSTTPGPDHAPGVLGAYNTSSGALLWAVKLSNKPIDPRLESDVQEDHIKTLTATPNGKLSITTETGRKYEVDPATKQARALP